MKDTLALALVRAESCRACAAERSRPKHNAGAGRASAVVTRVRRTVRALCRALPRRCAPG